MINIILIFAGGLAIFMGITGRYQQVLAVLVTGWAPASASAHA